MTTDLWMLVASVALTWLLMIIAATPTLLGQPRWALGSRDDPPEPPGLVQRRMQRTSANMKENLPLFAALVLVAHVAGAANATSALSAQIFVAARIVHAALYMAGVAYARTVAWAVSIARMAMVATPLF